MAGERARGNGRGTDKMNRPLTLRTITEPGAGMTEIHSSVRMAHMELARWIRWPGTPFCTTASMSDLRGTRCRLLVHTRSAFRHNLTLNNARRPRSGYHNSTESGNRRSK